MVLSYEVQASTLHDEVFSFVFACLFLGVKTLILSCCVTLGVSAASHESPSLFIQILLKGVIIAKKVFGLSLPLLFLLILNDSCVVCWLETNPSQHDENPSFGLVDSYFKMFYFNFDHFYFYVLTN